jgi:hypothetical protein
MSTHSHIESGADPWGRGDDTYVPPRLTEALARVERAMHDGAVEPLEGPPPEVRREMLAAERAWESLAAQGREVRFETGADGRVSIELTDRTGRALDVIRADRLFRLLKLA